MCNILSPRTGHEKPSDHSDEDILSNERDIATHVISVDGRPHPESMDIPFIHSRSWSLSFGGMLGLSFSRTFLISFLIILSQFTSRFIQMIGSYLHPGKPGGYLALYLTCRAIDDAAVANMYFVLYGYSTSRPCVRTSNRLG